MKLTYQDYVRKGKKLLHAAETHQATIAFYASCVCSIRHGGSSRGHYTLSDYARDIGMHKKTLSEWSITYRHVIERLNLDPSKVTQTDWQVATRVSNLLRDEKRQIQEASGQKRKKGRAWDIKFQVPVERIRDLFVAEMNGRSAQSEIDGYTDRIINIKNKLRRMNLEDVSEVSLRSLKMNLDEASSEITNYLMNSKGTNMTQLTTNGGIHV